MTPAYRATRRLTGLSNPILIVSGVIGLRRLVSASKRALRAQPRHRRAAGHDDIPPRGGAGDGGPEPTLAADRYRTIVDVYVLLRRPAGTILLLERSGTGCADGRPIADVHDHQAAALGNWAVVVSGASHLAHPRVAQRPVGLLAFRCGHTMILRASVQ
jgi:hypothetical protein